MSLSPVTEDNLRKSTNTTLSVPRSLLTYVSPTHLLNSEVELQWRHALLNMRMLHAIRRPSGPCYQRTVPSNEGR